MRLSRQLGALALLPLVAAACSNGGAAAEDALGLGSPSVSASATPSVTSTKTEPPSADPRHSRKASATPTATATPTKTPAASPGTHRSSPKPDPSRTKSQRPSPKPKPSKSSRPAATFTIHASNYQFAPDTKTVSKGTKVTVLVDEGQHTWTSGSAGFDFGQMTAGQRYSFTFNSAGTYNFICSNHNATFQMRGKITVTS